LTGREKATFRREAISNLLVQRFAESRAVICRDVDLPGLVFAGLERHRSGAAIVGVITTRATADTVVDCYDG
jgi:hypothetical protein